MSHEMMSPRVAPDQSAPRPGWLRTLDEGRKRAWRKPTVDQGQGARFAGYVVSIIVNAILIAITRAIPSWDLPFVTGEFGAVVPTIQRSLVVAIMANALLCAYDMPWFQHLAAVVMNAFALSATIAIARVFPFDFGSSGGNDFAHLLAVLVCIAVVVAVFVEAVKMLLALASREPESDE